jgi:uncharacterized protein YqgC (DUF456 family)
MDPHVYLVLAAIVVIVGLVGTVVPVLPGVLLVFGGLFLAAWAEGFTRVGAAGLTIIGFLAALAFAADLVASWLGAKRVGASPAALRGRDLGALVGLFFGLPGLVLGPFLGAVAGELFARRDLAQAGRSASAPGSGFSPPALARWCSPS